MDAVTAAPAGEVCTVFLRDIIRDAGYQIRTHTDRDTVKRYARLYNEGVKFPPVEIARVSGALVLVDGWHRVEAQELNHKDRVEATIVDVTEQEARWKAAEANLKHGRPLKPRDFRRVFRAYMHAERWRKRLGATYARGKSYREIATEIGGVEHTTIRNWMRADFPSIARKLSIGGVDKFKASTSRRPPRDPLAESARRHFEEAAAAGRGVTDFAARGDVLRHGRRAIATIKAATPAPTIGEADAEVSKTQAVDF